MLRCFEIDFCYDLGSILGAKIDKKLIKNQDDFGVIQKLVLGRKIEIKARSPAECARLLETLERVGQSLTDLEG